MIIILSLTVINNMHNIILLLIETKNESSFTFSQFKIDGFSIPYRFYRGKFGGETLIYVREDIPSKLLTEHKLPYYIESLSFCRDRRL